MSVFVDTNVLVYARDADAGTRRERAVAWLEHLWRTRAGRLSYQVLQEFYVTVTAKLPDRLPAEVARADVRDLLAWHPERIDDRTLTVAWEVQDRFGLSFWDGLIVAAAQASGCRHLLTEDLQDGQDLGGVIVVDPFRHEPGEPS